MANEQNLINLKDRTPRERREISRKGAEATNKLIAQRKTLKQELSLLLEQTEEGKTNQERMSVALFKEALKGNTKAFEIIRDTIGEKPKEIIDANVNTDIKVTLTDD
jgi:hypothetical protein